ncbi:MAG: YdeI/OmpD-associated family protein [bacterium]
MDNKNSVPTLENLPKFVQEALQQHDLCSQFRIRPKHQQINYLRWINSAQRSKVKIKRLNQMLQELKCGDKYLDLPIP